MKIQPVAARDRAAFAARKQLRILDVGCGAGFFSVLLANEGHRVTGIDLTPAMMLRRKRWRQQKAAAVLFRLPMPSIRLFLTAALMSLLPEI